MNKKTGFIASQKIMTLMVCLAIGIPAFLETSISRAQIPRFKIENPDSGRPAQRLGYSLAVDGDTMIAGAPATVADGNMLMGIARIYVKSANANWVLQTEITKPDNSPNNGMDFGYSVSVSGDTAIVGTISEAAYIFGRSILPNGKTTWTLQSKLESSDPAWQDCFGYSVAISGDVAIVGACRDDESGPLMGSAYIFERDKVSSNPTSWTLRAKLTTDDHLPHDEFGRSVSVFGDTAVVGTEGNGVFVYKRNITLDGAIWQLQTKLVPPDSTADYYLGYNVAISGNTIATTAISYDDDHWPTKSCLIYTHAGEDSLGNSIWAQQAELRDPRVEPSSYSSFGDSIALSDDTLLISNPDNYGDDYFGSAYVFARSNTSNGTTWTQQARLFANNPKSGEFFGYAVAVTGDTAFIGAPDAGNLKWLPASGFVNVFLRKDTTWSETQKLTSLNAAMNDEFGRSVAIFGNTAIVGAPYDGYLITDAYGSAYIYKRNGLNSEWILQQKFTPLGQQGYLGFGKSVSISGETALISDTSGSAYVFKPTDTGWIQQAKLMTPDLARGDSFGACVSVFENTAVIGAPLRDENGTTNTGAAYVFVFNGSSWIQQAKLTAPDGEMNDNFGGAVSISNDTVVVGAINAKDSASSLGLAYVFSRTFSSNGAVWTLESALAAPDSDDNAFGYSVSISDDTIAVGAIFGSDEVPYSGSACIFTRSKSSTGATWSLQKKLEPLDPVPYEQFGVSVSVSGDLTVVGTQRFAIDNNVSSGLAYLFRRSGLPGDEVWTQETKLMSDNGENRSDYSGTVAIDAGQVILGAPWMDDPEISSGVAYVYDFGQPGSPLFSSFSINGESVSTADRIVTLNNTCSNSPTHYAASESPNFLWTEWKEYSSSPTFTLSSGNGTKTVYFKAKNENGESAVVSDTIILDNQPASAGEWMLFE